MSDRFIKALTLAAVIGLPAAASAEQARLNVYAPDYFASDWGPGPGIKAAFEAECACEVNYVTGDVLPRILLEGKSHKADIIMGLTTDQTARARESGLFGPHGQDTTGLTIPIDWTDEVFVPFDWSEMAFVYDDRRLENPPASFAALLDAPDDLKIVLQDPRSSASGLGLMMWVESVFGDQAEEAWAKLAPKVLTVTKGWSEAYGLFTDGEADMVLSFTTSPAYHIIAEDDRSKHAAIFDEGHYFYAELAARTADAPNPELADQFMAFILSPAFQGMIAEGNWSYPSKLAEADLPQGFRDLPRPAKTLFLPEAEAEALRKPALERFMNAFAR